MILTVTYSVEIEDECIEKIKRQINLKPSLTPYLNIKDYLRDRLTGTVMQELQQEYDENIGIKCKQRYFELHLY